MIKKLLLIVLFCVLSNNLLFSAEPLRTEKLEMAINFTLSDLENKEVSLADFKGKPIILFFWTTWCPYCRNELKKLNAMHAELLKSGIQLAAIDIEEPLEGVEKFIKGYSFSFKVLLDKDGKVASSYEVVGVPTYIMINKEGRILSYDHSFPEKELKRLILK